VEMPENAFLMIHNPWCVSEGDADTMIEAAEFLEKIKTSLITVYHSKTGIDKADLSEMMNSETWLMAGEAVKLGFADKVIDQKIEPSNVVFNHVKNFKNLPSQLMETLGVPKNETKENNQMAEEKKEVAAITLETLKEQQPALVKQLLEDGARTERERIKDVEAQLMPGHEALINKLKYDGKTTGPEAAMQVVQAEKAVLAQTKADINADAIEPVEQPATPAVDNVDTENLPLDERAKANWDKNGTLRSEFDGDFDSYLAYMQATAAGNVKVLGKKENK